MGQNTPHGENDGGDKRRGELKRDNAHDARNARNESEPEIRETWADVFEERVVREILGVGAELMVEDGDGGHEVGEGAGEGEGEIDEEREVCRLLGVGVVVVVGGGDEGDGGHTVGEGTGVGESEFDEDRSVRNLLVQIEELELEYEESEVEALLAEFGQSGDEEQVLWLTTSLGRLSLTDSQRGPLLHIDYVPAHGATIEHATGGTNDDDAMDVDSPERDGDAMDIDCIPFL